MATFNNTVDEAGYGNYAGGGGGMFGGFGMMGILFALVIFWLIFERRDNHRDESNYEQGKYMSGKLDKEYEAIRGEGEKTRILIEQNYIQDLRDKNAEKDRIIQKLESEGFTTALYGKLMGEIADIKCHMPKRRPEWAMTVTPCAGELPLGCGPRRGRCDDFDAA
jgi:hypothetical protein